MANNIRSEYIKNLVEERDKLTQKLEDTTKNTLQNIVEESINKQLRNMISEANDDFEEEEVKTDTEEITDGDVENPDDTDSDTVDTDSDTDTEDVAGAEGSDDTDDDTASEEMWDGLEDFKGEDGEYDLTGMGKEDVIKVLKVMKPEDGVRVVKNGNGSVTLTDDETEKEYIIDIDGSIESEDESGTEDNDEVTFELETDDMTDECGIRTGNKVNEGEVDLGYTTEYQKETAMTTPDNHEPADSKETYSMDAGVPTGTDRPWGKNKGDGKPFTEGKVCPNCGKEDCTCNEEEINEVHTSTENSAQARGTAITNSNSNKHRKFARNQHEEGKQVRGTGEGYSEGTNESIQIIKKKANSIFRENKELRSIAEAIKNKLEEAIVVNSSLGSIIKLVTENSTTIDEKKDIIRRFDNVKTINEGKALYNTIAEELKRANKVNNTSENKLDGQLTESKKTKLVETTMYQSADLSATLSLMERLNKM